MALVAEQFLGQRAFPASARSTATLIPMQPALFEEALPMYKRLSNRHSVGRTRILLARVAADDDERRRHLHAADEASLSIGRGDLMTKYMEEFAAE